MKLEARPDRSAPAWMVWGALWVVYIVWGSTYLAIRVVVETVPPLTSAAIRFLIAGALLYLWLAIRHGRAHVKVTARQLAASTAVGAALLFGGNGLVSIAELDVPSGLAALLIASAPLWVVILRRVFGERVPLGTLGGVVVGFAGVGLLVLSNDRAGGAPIGGMLLLIAAAAFWAGGSFFSKRLPLPADPFVSTAVQMLCGGVVLVVAGLARGELWNLDPAAFSAASLFGIAYLIVFGSLLAFTSYVWLLQHAPISKVATYAYVNPVIAVFAGWLILSEEITSMVIVSSVIIVASVATIVRKESGPPQEEVAEAPIPAFARADA